MMNKIKTLYKNSFIFKKIDKLENKHYQKQLTNSDFTILCPNCIGGLIYHRLGQKFDSPTIDLSINTEDFSYFLEYLDYYISKDVEPSGFNKDGKPVGVIQGNGNEVPNIYIHFTHYNSFESGRDKWNQRKIRIHKDNCYIIAYDLNDMFEEDSNKCGYINNECLERISNFKSNNKVLFTRNPECECDFSYYIEPNYNGPFPLVYLNRNIIGLMPFETEFDFTNFINKKL